MAAIELRCLLSRAKPTTCFANHHPKIPPPFPNLLPLFQNPLHQSTIAISRPKTLYIVAGKSVFNPHCSSSPAIKSQDPEQRISTTLSTPAFKSQEPEQRILTNLSSPTIQSQEPAKRILRNLSYSELATWVESIGFRKSHATMLWRCLYSPGQWAATIDSMQTLSNTFRAELAKSAELNVLKLETVHTAADGTNKIVFSVPGGTVETVIIPCSNGRGRTTVCVSSQLGCAMNCQFCFTGRMGLKRNLTTAEIVEQVVVSCRLFSNQLGPITNVVFMGMGEPLQNSENVIRAANIMIDEQGLHLSHHKVTVSTCGLVPQIREFLRGTVCSLAVSLNATTDEVRNWIMPINRKYSLAVLLSALREELGMKPGRLVFFEYVMLAGVNDGVDDAERLVGLVEGINCKVNLICFNPHAESGFRASSKEQMLMFRDVVARAGICVHIRESRGDDQMAACGQLGTLGEQLAPRMSVPERFQAAVGV